MSTIATYPAPSTDIMEAARAERVRRRSGRPLSAAFKYARGATVNVDGVDVMMSVQCALDILKLTEQLGQYIPVCVDHADYQRAVAEIEKRRTFKAMCKTMGLVDGRKQMDGKRCDCGCGTSGAGIMVYEPDAMGRPTPVLFMRDGHGSQA